MASNVEFDVMISYNQKSGTDCMNKLLRELRKRDYNVWIDVEQMRRNVYDHMAEAIASSFIIVPLVSEAYESSENCKLELKMAQLNQKAIIPVKIEDYRPPTDSWLSLILSDRCYYKIFENVDETAKLIDAIEEELKKWKTDLQPKERLPTQESAGNQNQNYDESASSMTDERGRQQNATYSNVDGCSNANSTRNNGGQPPSRNVDGSGNIASSVRDLNIHGGIVTFGNINNFNVYNK